MRFPVLLTGDLHVTHRNLHLFEIFIKQVISLEEEFETFIVVGDLFDSQDVTKWEAILAVCDFLNHVNSIGKDIFLLSGTHDTLFLNRNRSTLQIFGNCAQVITSRLVFDNCLWIPHSRDLEGDIAFLKKYGSHLACFTHHMVRGLQIGTFIVPHGLPLDLLQQSEWSFNGHIHQPQLTGNFLNVGSPWQHSFAEANQGKFLWLWNGRRVRPIRSAVEPQYVVGSLEELQDLRDPLKGKSVRVLLKLDDNLERVTEFLNSTGALRWEFRFPSQQTSWEISPAAESQHLDELVDRWASAKDLLPDDTQMGKVFLEGLQ